MEITLYVIAGVIAFLFGSALAFFVGYKSWHNPPRRSFALVTQFASLWCLFPVAATVKVGEEANLFLVRLVYIAAALTPPCLLQFIFDVTEDRRLLLKRAVLSLAYLASGCFVLLTFHPQFIIGLTGRAPNFPFIPGRLFHAFAVYYIWVCLMSFLVLIQNLLKIETRNRIQLQYVALASVIGIFTPLFHFSGAYFNWEPFPHEIFLITYSSIIAYAIVKHQIMDITVVFRKGLVYSILVAVITVTSLVIVVVVENLLRGLMGYRSLVGTVMAALVIAVGFIPVRNAIQEWVDRAFFGGSQEKLAQENERLKDELVKAERLKAVSTLAAGLAHEIKNPLTAIKTFTAFLPEKGAEPEFQKKFARIVSKEVERIDATVRQLLAFAKPTPPSLQPVRLGRLLEETVELLSNECVHRRITVERTYAREDTIQADPQQLRQVFLNLCLNGLEAMDGAGGTLTLRLEQPTAQRIRVAIGDSGRGIAPEHRERLFEPFFTTKPTGTGLGLAMVHRIVTEHGGTITVDSAVGQGTTVSLEFPAASLQPVLA